MITVETLWRISIYQIEDRKKQALRESNIQSQTIDAVNQERTEYPEQIRPVAPQYQHQFEEQYKKEQQQSQEIEEEEEEEEQVWQPPAIVAPSFRPRNLRLLEKIIQESQVAQSEEEYNPFFVKSSIFDQKVNNINTNQVDSAKSVWEYKEQDSLGFAKTPGILRSSSRITSGASTPRNSNNRVLGIRFTPFIPTVVDHEVYSISKNEITDGQMKQDNDNRVKVQQLQEQQDKKNADFTSTGTAATEEENNSVKVEIEEANCELIGENKSIQPEKEDKDNNSGSEKQPHMVQMIKSQLYCCEYNIGNREKQTKAEPLKKKRIKKKKQKTLMTIDENGNEKLIKQKKQKKKKKQSQKSPAADTESIAAVRQKLKKLCDARREIKRAAQQNTDE